jgi:DNA segregation ATPase FtsK/SpoIIIE-like protein
MDATTSRIEDRIALRIRHEQDVDTAVEVRWYSDTRVSGLARALGEHLSITGKRQLGLPAFRALLPPTALASDCQLTHGVLVELITDSELPMLPALSPDDAVRLVHEAGPQTGHAWPFKAEGQAVALDVDADSGQVTMASEDSEAGLVVVLNDIGALSVVCDEKTYTLRIDGAARSSRADAHVGSLVELLPIQEEPTAGGRDPVLAAWRIYSGSEHEAMRRVTHTVSYRVGAPDTLPLDTTPETLRIGASPPDRPPKLDVTELALQIAPFLALAIVLMIVRIGSPIYGVVLLLYPAFQVFQRVRRHRSDVAAHREDWANWRKETSSQLGMLRRKASEEAAYLRALEPPTESLASAALQRSRGLWARRPPDDYFLRSAVGVGTYRTPSRVEIQGSLVDGNLEDWRAHAEATRLVSDVPALSDVSGANLALVGPTQLLHGVAGEALLRIALTHSPASLSMALFMPARAQQLDAFDWLRWLPHLNVPTALFVGPRIRRGAADCTDATETAAAALANDVPDDQHLLIVVHESCGVRIEALRDLLLKGSGLIHVVWLGASQARSPEFVRQQLQLEAGGELARLTPSSDPVVRPLDDDRLDLEAIAAALAPLTDEVEAAVSASVPSLVDLGSVIDVGRGDVEDQILRGWRDGDPTDSLVASLGRTAGGTFELDLVKEGPHVLLAGTTGSGKSELLRTMLTSLAVRYSPRDLAMVLVDFKGGAALHQLEAIPHVIGMASNLEPHDVDRTVAFLDAEISRRQRRLREVQGEYRTYRQRGGVEPLARLVVVIDEFQGFMGGGDRRLDAMINLAARGRSLGVHLVLSTQRPRGAVDPGITANVNARLCLRTLDEADSISVIDAPHAASIHRTLPGRCFARMEAGSLVEFQAAYTGSVGLATRESTAGVIVTPFHSVLPPVEYGEVDASGEQEDPVTDIEFLVRHIGLAAQKVPLLSEDDQPRLRKSLSDLDAVEAPRLDKDAALAEIALGIRDEPEHQRQEIHKIDLRKGAVLLSGGTQLGKTTTLEGLARQLMWRDARAGVVAIDGGDGALMEALEGEVLASVSTDRPADLNHIVDQLGARMGQMPDQPVLVLIDRLDEVQRVFRTQARLDALVRLMALGPARGVYVAATADPRVELEAALRTATAERLGFVPHNAGLVVTQEEQRIKLFLPPRDQLPERSQTSRPFGYPPAKAAAEVAHGNGGGTVALGVDEITHDPIGVRIRAGFLIAGVPRSGRTVTLLSLAARLMRYLSVSHPGYTKIPYLGPEGQTPPLDWLLDLRAPLEARAEDLGARARYLADLWSEEPRVVVIDGVDDLASLLPAAPGGAVVLARELESLLARRRVRVLATSELSNRSPLSAATELSMLHVSRRNFVILKPPPREIVNSLGVFAGASFYDELVKPRDDREYLPGEGTLVTPAASHRLRVVPEPEVLSALAQLNARTVDW